MTTATKATNKRNKKEPPPVFPDTLEGHMEAALYGVRETLATYEGRLADILGRAAPQIPRRLTRHTGQGRPLPSVLAPPKRDAPAE